MQQFISNANSVIVVLGASADLISKEMVKMNAYIIENKEWGEEMASSVRIGLNTLQKTSPLAEAVIFMVCDQPYVSSVLIK